MKTFLWILLVSVVSAPAIVSTENWLASRRDYKEEIATARILLEGGTVDPAAYKDFAAVGCYSSGDYRYFYKRAGSEGLIAKDLKDLCSNVQSRSMVVKK